MTTVVVTRPRGQADELVDALERAGYDVVRCPLIEIVPLGDDTVDVSGYDWVILTSANGAAELARRMTGRVGRVAAIGAATAAAFGRPVDLVPAVSTQEGLLEELPRPAGPVLVAAAEGARRLIVDELDADFVALYRTIELRPPLPPAGDLAVVASPSAARALARSASTLPVVSIGPETSRACRAAGLTLAAEAETQDAAGLVAAVAAAAAP